MWGFAYLCHSTRKYIVYFYKKYFWYNLYFIIILNFLDSFQVDAVSFSTVSGLVSLTITLLHIAVLIKSYKTNCLRMGLVVLALGDFIRFSTILVASNCLFKQLLLEFQYLCTFTSVLYDAIFVAVLACLVLICIDRYFASRHAFLYAHNHFTIHFNRLAMSLWVIVMSYIFMQLFLFMDGCMVESQYCSVYLCTGRALYSIYLSQHFLLCILSMVIVTICFLAIIREFYLISHSPILSVSPANSNRKIQLVIP